MIVVFERGHLCIGGFTVKDVRRAASVSFSDRYASWHLGPFVVRVSRWPRPSKYTAAAEQQREQRLMAWRRAA